MMKILNYPKTLDESKDLIDMIVARYNEVTAIRGAHCSTYEGSKEFIAPHGLNGGSENLSDNLRGGVGFRNDGVFGVTYEHGR